MPLGTRRCSEVPFYHCWVQGVRPDPPCSACWGRMLLWLLYPFLTQHVTWRLGDTSSVLCSVRSCLWDLESCVLTSDLWNSDISIFLPQRSSVMINTWKTSEVLQKQISFKNRLRDQRVFFCRSSRTVKHSNIKLQNLNFLSKNQNKVVTHFAFNKTSLFPTLIPFSFLFLMYVIECYGKKI